MCSKRKHAAPVEPCASAHAAEAHECVERTREISRLRVRVTGGRDEGR